MTDKTSASQEASDMWKNEHLPEFGPLQGVKVVHSTFSLAGPLAAQILADYGADVIWIENPLSPDLQRGVPNHSIEPERKNQRTIALNIPTEQGRKVFLDLIADADVFIENSKGGQYERWGLTDEVMWEANPKLVICHISGFGQTGDPDYVKRPSFDSIAQAFSGFTEVNTNEGEVPSPVGPYMGDYSSGIFAAMGVLAALYRAEKTGEGESIDLAQYEALMRIQWGSVETLTYDTPQVKAVDPDHLVGIGAYPCKDGVYIEVSIVGAPAVRKACELIGMPYGTELLPEGVPMVYRHSEAAAPFLEKLEAFLSERTAAEAEHDFLEAGIAASRVNELRDLRDDPHVAARGSIEHIKSVKGDELDIVSAVPKFTKHPCKSWRAMPYMGMDNEEILGELGYSDSEIQEMYEQSIIANDPEMKLVYPFD